MSNKLYIGTDFGDFKSAIASGIKKLESGSRIIKINSHSMKSEVWEVFLGSFPSEGIRQHHNCNNCNSFLRKSFSYMGLVDGEITSMWAMALLELSKASPYRELATQLDAIVMEAMKSDPLISYVDKSKDGGVVGISSNVDIPTGIKYSHLAFKFVGTSGGSLDMDLQNSRALIVSLVDQRILDSIKKAINDNPLQIGEGYIATLESMKSLNDSLGGNTKKIILSKDLKEFMPSVNSSVGSWIKNLSEGMNEATALSKYMEITRGDNYRVSSTASSVSETEQLIQELEDKELVNSLYRVRATLDSIPIERRIFTNSNEETNRPLDSNDDILDILSTMSTRKKVIKGIKPESISREDFLDMDFGGAEVEILVREEYYPYIFSATAPKFPDSPSIFKGESGLGIVYSGNYSSPVDRLVEDAGGSVEGVITNTLAWYSGVDLDLGLTMPNGDVIDYGNYGDKKGAHLDVDMNYKGIHNLINPVENITVPEIAARSGTYRVQIINSSNLKRFERSRGDAEIYVTCRNGREIQKYHVNVPDAVHLSSFTKVASYSYSKDKGVFDFESKYNFEKMETGVKSWGISQGSFYPVSSIFLSPECWGWGNSANPHILFSMGDCITDEPVSPIMITDIKPEYNKYRKAISELSRKLPMEHQKQQLNGLGFPFGSKEVVTLMIKEGDDVTYYNVEI